MDCKKYQSWLNDEALGELPPARSAELHSHLAACADCRAELERRRLFLSAMDQAVAASSAGEPSPVFAARVRGRIAEQPAAAPWFSGWVPWTAGVAVTLAALMTYMFLPKERSETPHRAVAHVTKKIEPSETESKPAAAAAPSMEPKTVRKGSRTRPAVPAIVQQAPAAVEVIIPRDEVEGIAWLARQLHQKPAQTTTLLADLRARTERQTEPLHLEDRKIAPLEIAPVEKLTGSDGSSSTEGKEQE